MYEQDGYKFLLTRPLRDVTNDRNYKEGDVLISTHTPLAGRDDNAQEYTGIRKISTHTPLAGRDCHQERMEYDWRISTHTPLAGRDRFLKITYTQTHNFYSHAPCGT